MDWVLELVKVLIGFLGGGASGFFAAWLKAKQDRLVTQASVSAAAEEAKRVGRKESLDQSLEFSDRLLAYQDKIREEMLEVYNHLHECWAKEARMKGFISWMQEQFKVPPEQQWQEESKPAPTASEFLRTPIAKTAVEFLHRTVQQDRVAIEETMQAKRDESESLKGT